MTSRTDRRIPLWRRILLNRHQLFALHILVFIAGSIYIWTLNAPLLDRQFDTLFWLTLLCAHGLILYFRQRAAFIFHLLMFSAGNAAIWSTTASIGDKLTVIIAWSVVAAMIGIWLYRRMYRQQAAPLQRVPKRKPTPKPAPVLEPAYDDYEYADDEEPGEHSTPVRRGRRRN